MSVKVRFAPSPTGFLHVGNIRTALVNWLFAAKNSGSFVLRIDDTDKERSKPEFETAIFADMAWLGLAHHETHKQSERSNSYAAGKQKLLDSGRLYACYETQEELDVKRKFQLSRGQPPIYDRSALKLSTEQKAAYEAEGRRAHFRFLLNDEKIIWNDLIRGENIFEGHNLSDPVLFREDGVPTYTMSSVVDDGEMNITHVIRGEDHVSNTAVQIQLFHALFGRTPEFAHLALLKTKEGEISKRLGGFSIQDLRSSGVVPLAIHSYLAKLGTSQGVVAAHSMQDLVNSLDFGHFGRAPANYDFAELERINGKVIAGYSYAEAKPYLKEIGVGEWAESFWDIVKTNINRLDEINTWHQIVSQPISPVIDDPEFNQIAIAELPKQDWDTSTWGIWTKALQGKTGRKGKELFMPLRKALTGQDHGPELAKILPLIGREKSLKRLQGIAA